MGRQAETDDTDLEPSGTDPKQGTDAKRGSGTGKRRGPRKATPARLEKAALHYLGRFAASTEALRRVLLRRVERSHHLHGTDLAEGQEAVEKILIRFQELGYLNDRRFAEQRAEGLLARGTPVTGIRYRLKSQGLSESDIEHALQYLEGETEATDLNLAAAVKLARRRRLGPFRTGSSRHDDDRNARREKDLAALARAGFDYDTALTVIDAETPEDLESEL